MIKDHKNCNFKLVMSIWGVYITAFLNLKIFILTEGKVVRSTPRGDNT